MCRASSVHLHAAMMNRLATAHGVDLTEALKSRHLSAMEWRDAVVACMGCAHVEPCQRRLNGMPIPNVCMDAQAGMGVPAYCVNRRMMERLWGRSPSGDAAVAIE